METTIEAQNTVRPAPKPPQRGRVIKAMKFVAVFIVIVAAMIIIKDEIVWQNGAKDTDSDTSAKNIGANESECNVMGINLHGFLSDYISNDIKDENEDSTEDQVASEDIVTAIQTAVADGAIKAIVLEVDSPGGLAMAGEEVAIALRKSPKPTVAMIRGQGLSAAYWSATGAEIIFASAVSDVGSIGVTLSYLDNYKKNLQEGLTFNSLSTGKFKDTGNSDKPLTSEERVLLMRDLNIVNEQFIKSVSANRKLDIVKVRKLADGSSMPGEMALQNGLIDKIGGIYEIFDYLKEKIGEEVAICW